MSVLAAAGTMALVGCVEEPDAPQPEAQGQNLAPGAQEPPVQPEVVALNTFDPNTVEIDRLGNGPGDANVFSAAAAPGGDPADSSAHNQLPTGATGTYIDWENHAADAANHRIIDDVKSDSDIFTSGDCIGAGQVTKKFDTNAMLIASTDKDVQMGWSINDDNGSYSWTLLFTKLEPSLEPGTGNGAGGNGCKANEFFLTYDLSGANGGAGDVAVRGVFTPGAATLFVYRAKGDFADVPGPDAHDVSNTTYWEPIAFADGEIVAAVNSTIMRPGSILDPNLVKYDTVLTANGGPAIEANTFSEGSVPLSTFTGGSACGATFFTSGSTQSSQSGNSDHKDFVRVAAVNLGDLTVTSRLAPTCDEDVFYEVTEVLGFDSQPLPSTDYTCNWEFFDEMAMSVGTVMGSCSGVWTPPGGAGTYSAEVTVVQTGGLGCTDTSTLAAVTTYGALSATADVAGTCTAGSNGNESTMNYSGTVSGGSGSYSYAWMFGADDAMACPACAATPSSATDLPTAAMPGSFEVNLANNAYRGDLEVTDTGLSNAVTDAGVATTCTFSTSDTDTPLAPLTVSLTLSSGGATCSDMPPISTDAATWNAIVSGGNGNYVLDWTGGGCVDGNTSCTVDPSDSTFCDSASLQLNVTDDSGLCTGADSETETYSKQTIVTASDN